MLDDTDPDYDPIGSIMRTCEDDPNSFEEIDRITGDVISDSRPVEKFVSYIPRKYNLDDAESILLQISKGYTIKETEEYHQLIPNTISSWLRTHPDFYQKYLEARKLRSFAFEDNMISLAKDNRVTKDNVSVYKYRFDALSKLASYGNKDEFVAKSVNNNHTGNVSITVDTGIRREEYDRPETGTQGESPRNIEFSENDIKKKSET